MYIFSLLHVAKLQQEVPPHAEIPKYIDLESYITFRFSEEIQCSRTKSVEKPLPRNAPNVAMGQCSRGISTQFCKENPVHTFTKIGRSPSRGISSEQSSISQSSDAFVG